MNYKDHSCFVIMPFTDELHYFFLYMKKHIEEKHGISCIRGDADKLTVPVLDKIKDYIRNSDVLIADCSGRNPNVFYELGMAHILGKKVILITSDPIREAPTDIRHFEFIRYTLGKHVEFFEQLDNALHNIFTERYEELYNATTEIFLEFRAQTNSKVEMVPRNQFIERVSAAGRKQNFPLPDDRWSVMEFALPRLVAGYTDFQVMNQLTSWITSQLERR